MGSRSRRTVLAVGAAVVAGAGVVLVLQATNGDRQDASADGATAAASAAPPSFSTPTQSAPRPLENVEPGPDDPVATDEPSTVMGGQVDVVVTFAGVEPAVRGVEVDGFVEGVIEDGGTCTLRLTSDDLAAEVSVDALPDASTTSCGALVVPLDQLSSGSWRGVLSYTSSTSTGSSDPVTVEVP